MVSIAGRSMLDLADRTHSCKITRIRDSRMMRERAETAKAEDRRVPRVRVLPVAINRQCSLLGNSATKMPAVFPAVNETPLPCGEIANDIANERNTPQRSLETERQATPRCYHELDLRWQGMLKTQRRRAPAHAHLVADSTTLLVTRQSNVKFMIEATRGRRKCATSVLFQELSILKFSDDDDHRLARL